MIQENKNINELSDGKMSFSVQVEQSRNDGSILPISSVIHDFFDQMSKATNSSMEFLGLSTGLRDLDNMLIGLDKSELIMIVGDAGIGKTTLALNIATCAGVNYEKSVTIFSLELSKDHLASRLLSRAALIPFKTLQTGKLNDRQLRDFTEAAQLLSSADIHINVTPALTVSDMIAQCRCIQRLDLVVVDYLQMIQSVEEGYTWSKENREKTGSDICRALKIMAKELNVPVICTADLSRDFSSRQDKRPMLADLHESGIIEQYADVVIGLYRDSYYKEKIENPYLTEAIVLKNRKGASGTVHLNWLSEYMTFSSNEYSHEDDC